MKTSPKPSPVFEKRIIADDQAFDPQPSLDCTISRSDNKSGNSSLALVLLGGADHFLRRLPDGGTLLAWDKHLGVASDDSFSDCDCNCEWCGCKVKREVLRWQWNGVCAQKSRLEIAITIAAK